LSSTDASTLVHAAALAAGAQQYPAGALYVVATPIGNLADLTLRAIHVLALADAVACEDTRLAGGLLKHLGLSKPLLPAHEHNEAQAAGDVIVRLQRGERVALVSDAGTPAISDPGARVVAAATTAGLRVVPVPGASSVTTAVSAAGDVHGQGFRCAGFLPAKGAARQRALRAALDDAGTVVLFESPHRIGTLARELAEAAPQRRTTVCRELTKQFETVATLDAAALPAWITADANRARGEFVLVLHAPADRGAAAAEGLAEATRALDVLLRELPLKQAVSLAAEISGAPRNALYDEALRRRAP
jgi:16S rRNA (cytidine1402-2'-O)-methyltransferase